MIHQISHFTLLGKTKGGQDDQESPRGMGVWEPAFCDDKVKFDRAVPTFLIDLYASNQTLSLDSREENITVSPRGKPPLREWIGQ